jgi:hypothetical protein
LIQKRLEALLAERQLEEKRDAVEDDEDDGEEGKVRDG